MASGRGSVAECAADTSEGQDYYEDFGPLPHVDDDMMIESTWKVEQLLCCKPRAKKRAAQKSHPF